MLRVQSSSSVDNRGDQFLYFPRVLGNYSQSISWNDGSTYIRALVSIKWDTNQVGVALINDADLMLPSPDGLIRTIAAVYHKKYPIVKIIGDCTWVTCAVIIELSVLHRLQAVHVGTVASALRVGRAIKVWNRLLFTRPERP